MTQSILPSSFPPKTRSSRKQLHEPMHKAAGTRGIQSNSFYYRAAKTWNNLPKEVVDVGKLNLFKNLPDDHWKYDEVKFNHVQITPGDS